MNIRNGWIISLISLLLVFLTACGSNTATEPSSSQQGSDVKAESGSAEKPADKPAVKVGLICGTMNPLLAEIGINDGSLEKAGVHIEKVCFHSGSDAVQALVGGSIDINIGSYEHVLRQRKNGLDVKAYAEIYNGIGYSLLTKKDSPYQKVGDLKNATLGVTKVGSLSDTGLRLFLKNEKLDPQRDVKIVSSGAGSTMLAALESGQVAAGMVPEPTSTQMLKSGKYKVLYDPKIDYAGIVLMAKTDWVEQNKQTMQDLLKVLHDIRQQTDKDPKSQVDAIMKEFGKVPRDVMETAYKNEIQNVPSDMKITKEGADAVVQSQIELGAISKSIPFDQTVDLSLLPQ